MVERRFLMLICIMIYNSYSSVLDTLVTFEWEIQRTMSGLQTNFVELACTDYRDNKCTFSCLKNIIMHNNFLVFNANMIKK